MIHSFDNWLKLNENFLEKKKFSFAVVNKAKEQDYDFKDLFEYKDENSIFPIPSEKFLIQKAVYFIVNDLTNAWVPGYEYEDEYNGAKDLLFRFTMMCNEPQSVFNKKNFEKESSLLNIVADDRYIINYPFHVLERKMKQGKVAMLEKFITPEIKMHAEFLNFLGEERALKYISTFSSAEFNKLKKDGKLDFDISSVRGKITASSFNL